MKKLVYFFWLNIFFVIPVDLSAQFNEYLGWKGNTVIPTVDFVKPANWHPNASSGDKCFVTIDSTDNHAIQLHWTFNPGTGYRYAQIYYIFPEPVSFASVDIIGIDIKGQYINNNCDNFGIRLKFENSNSASNAICSFNNMARINRWCENLSKLKSQFSKNSFSWDVINVVSLEVYSDRPVKTKTEGVVSFRNLTVESVSNWNRAASFEELSNSSSELSLIRKAVLDTIIGRQTATGLLKTWREDGSSWLYGQGLALKILSLNSSWKATNGDSLRCCNAAKRLASFLVGHQDTMGFWPRAWNATSGNILVNLEEDGSIWFGDFPWIITGLQNYFNRSNDSTVLSSIEKARHFLIDSLIDTEGKLYTLKKSNQFYTKLPVTSVEAYAAVILSLLELGETDKAVSLAKYIDSLSWSDSLKYWKESMWSTRVVLFANTWFSQLIRNNQAIAEAIDPTFQKSKEALSLVSRVLYTKGTGEPIGFDGIGPIATWLEGTLSYVSAGGPGSQTVFDSLVKSIEPGYGVIHYNDKVSCGIGDIWAEKWISLDGTSWLWFVTERRSPFKVFKDSVPETAGNSFTNDINFFSCYPNPVNNFLVIDFSGEDDDEYVSFFNLIGEEYVRLKVEHGLMEVDVSQWPNGIYYVRLQGSNACKVRKIMIRK